MNMLASFMNLAGGDLFIIFLIVLVLFGAKKLPELAKGMGQAIREFQKAKDEFSDELHKTGKTDVAARPASTTVPRIEAANVEPTTGAEANRPVEPGNRA